jgi:hypothetical protein
MSPGEQLLIEADRVRASGVLGDSRLRQLFDYLLEKTVAGESPKELVIAMDVFDKRADFNVGDDALVRVYMHKLRKALASFYGTATTGSRCALEIPKGDYRLRLQSPAADVPLSVEEIAVPTRGLPRGGWYWLVFLAVLVGIVQLLLAAPWSKSPDGSAAVAKSPVWSEILANDRPVAIVLGDYYLLGQTGDSQEVQRLIREFDINSRADLDRFRMQHPDEARHLVDVGFRYLPTSSADALRNVMAVLAPANRRISVRMMSELSVDTFKSSDVIYIGFVSGMGMLQDLAFAGSRLRIGVSYDELIDGETGRSYVSEDVLQVQAEDGTSDRRLPYHDYGFFAKVRGPAGNPILIIAGTRDEGVQETSEKLTNAADLAGIASRVDTGKPFEALFDVGALEGVDMMGRAIFVAPRH